MLVFNLSRVLALRGVDKPFSYLVKIGFYRTVASNLLNNKTVNIKISHIERLCRALNCTPSDLFEWKPRENETLGESHALNSLKRNSAQQFSRILKEIPVEKLEKAGELLNQLKNEQIVNPPEN